MNFPSHDKNALERLCRRHGIRRLSLFGSVLLHRVWQAAQSLGPSTTRQQPLPNQVTGRAEEHA